MFVAWCSVKNWHMKCCGHTWNYVKTRRHAPYLENGTEVEKGLSHCFPTFLMLRPFHIVPCAVVTPTITLFLLLLHNCNFGTVMECNINVFGDRGLPKGSVMTHRSRPVGLDSGGWGERWFTSSARIRKQTREMDWGRVAGDGGLANSWVQM